jgi:hypothetical protein
MSYQIVKQPDGQLAVWSTIVDSFVMIDATQPDVVDFLLNGQVGHTTRRVAEIVASLERGGKPYGQFTESWEDLQRTHIEVHGMPFDLEAERNTD